MSDMRVHYRYLAVRRAVHEAQRTKGGDSVEGSSVLFGFRIGFRRAKGSEVERQLNRRTEQIQSEKAGCGDAKEWSKRCDIIYLPCKLVALIHILTYKDCHDDWKPLLMLGNKSCRSSL